MAINPIKHYNTVIIGAGLTGCYLLNRILTLYSPQSVLLIDASSRLGGRVETVKFTDSDGAHIQYEAGGARFSDKHKRLNNLLKELDLYNQREPISSDVTHVLLPRNKLQTRYDDIIKIINYIKKYIKTHNIQEQELQKYTLYTFIKDVMHNSELAEYMLAFYEYYSELATLNMTCALDVFVKEFNSNVQYYVLKSGYESIITKLMDNIQCNKYCKLNTLVTHITKRQHFEITMMINNTAEICTSNNIIICIPVNALKKIKFNIPNANKINNICAQIKPEPLYRIYARFPKPLPESIGKITTNLPIKYIIPVDHKNGVVMLSYTDGIYAKKLYKIYQHDLLNDTDRLIKLLVNNLNQLLPYVTEDKEIKPFSAPVWIKHHYWPSGAGYWLPGKIPPLSDVIQPISGIGLYLAGEQLSSHQAWLEGCLETADMVLSKLHAQPKKTIKQLITYQTKKNDKMIAKGGVKTYTKSDVAQHNTPDDAWIIINGKVYNITNWISKHPGGTIILQGIGKDASSLFNNKGCGSGHSSAAHKILSKYYIGNLAKLE